MALDTLPEELIEHIEQNLSYPDRVSLRTALSNGDDGRSPYQRRLFHFWRELLGRVDVCINQAKENYRQMHYCRSKKRKLSEYETERHDYSCVIVCNGWSLPLIYGVDENDEKIFPWLVSRKKPHGTDIDQSSVNDQNTLEQPRITDGAMIHSVWITIYSYRLPVYEVRSDEEQAATDRVLPDLERTLKETNGTILTVGKQKITMLIRCVQKEMPECFFDFAHMPHSYTPFCVKWFPLRLSLIASPRTSSKLSWYTRWCCFHQNIDSLPHDLFERKTRAYENKIRAIIRERHPLVSDIVRRELAMFWLSYATPVPFTRLPDIFHLVTTWPIPPAFANDLSFLRLEFVNVTRDEFANGRTCDLHANTVVRLQWYLVNKLNPQSYSAYKDNCLRPQFPQKRSTNCRCKYELYGAC